MSNVLESIARENFRSSGYITHPSKERRIAWEFSTPPKSPFSGGCAVHSALQRRERAFLRRGSNSSLVRNCLNAFLRR